MTHLSAKLAGALGVIVIGMACGGGGGGSAAPPTSPSPPPGGTIQIVGESGPGSFNPNPAPLPGSRRMTWQNNDGVVHRIVANDGSFDTGNIAPGASSSTIELPADGARFHCTLHPTMVGAVNSAGGTTPPCTGLYC